MRRVLFLVVLVPLAIVLVILSVANRGAVVFSLDPFGGNALSFAAPLFVFLFASLLLGIVVGGVAAWLRQGRWRQAARIERAEANRLRNELERLRTSPPDAVSPATRDAA
jgi:uncharacterized integral membrane protein